MSLRRAWYSTEQLAAADAAGPPRAEASFAKREDWLEYQNAWFDTFTGETLPAVGDQDRAKRWKAARRQHGKIEQQRAAVGTKSMPSSSRDHPLGSLSPTSTMLGGASSARFYAASPNVGHAKHSRKDMTEFLESCGLAYLQTALSVAMPGSVHVAS